MRKAILILVWFASALVCSCLTKGSQTGTGMGSVLMPLANPSPGGMAGPEAADTPASMAGPVGGTAGAEDPIEEGTFSDTPIAVVGAPKGLTDKKRPCEETGFTLCFAGVKISDVGPDPEADPATGRRQFRIEGCFYKKITGPGTLVPLLSKRIDVDDLLFPESDLNPTRTNDLDGCFRQPTLVSGRPHPAPRVRLQASYCNRTTTLDLPLPGAEAPSLTFDPCSSSGSTDAYTGDSSPIYETGNKALDPNLPNAFDSSPAPEPEAQDPLDHFDFPSRTREPLKEIPRH